PCLKEVSSFTTSGGGGYLLFIWANDKFYTERFAGNNWGLITLRNSNKSWIAVAGGNIYEDLDPNSLGHVENSDHCRVHGPTPVYTVYEPSGCTPGDVGCYRLDYYAHAVNLAEVMYNEAGGETIGAMDTVGWTARNRAFQRMKQAYDTEGQLVDCTS